MLDKKDSKLSEELICLKHLKPLDYICCTCRMKLCEVCRETDHQNEMFSGHELVSFNTYVCIIILKKYYLLNII